MDEIKELREQMNAMRQSLDSYAIINDRLMKSVMKERAKDLNRLVIGEIIALPFIALFYFGICLALDMTIWLAIAATAGSILSTLVDVRTVKVPGRMVNGSSLRGLKEYLLKQKRMRAVQTAVELPLSIAWLVWFLLAFMSNDMMFGDLAGSETFAWVKYGTVGIAILLTLVSVCLIYRKIQNINNSIINEIDAMDDSSAD